MTTMPNSSIKLDNKRFSFQEITLMLWSFAVLSCWLPRSCPSTICSQQAPLQSLKAPCPPEKAARASVQQHGPVQPFFSHTDMRWKGPVAWFTEDLWKGLQYSTSLLAQCQQAPHCPNIAPTSTPSTWLLSLPSPLHQGKVLLAFLVSSHILGCRQQVTC